MGKNKKIGILTLFHENYNWGGVLQAYALKMYLESLVSDCSVDLLHYTSETNIIYKNKIQQALQYSPVEIAAKVYNKLHKVGGGDISTKLQTRNNLFRFFMDEISTNPFIYNDGNLISAALEYDCLICGSDQIWNPNVARPGFFLQMVNDQCVKIAYAASIARDDLSKQERKVMLPLIRNFDYVSVRESTAMRYLNSYFENNSVCEVLDPALMLDKNIWEKLSDASEKIYENDQYALAFFFSESLSYRGAAYRYCKKKGLKLLFIPFAKGELIESDLAWPGEKIYDVGPKEFIGLFKNAKYIFTDSFHGAVFSIMFSKNFCVFERDKNNNVSKNSRLYDLLRKFNLSKRLAKKPEDVEEIINDSIDYKKVDKLLNKYRDDSRAFLLSAISSVKTTMETQNGNYFRNRTDLKSEKFDCYLGYNKKDNVRENSSSGGLFFELASAVIRKNGVVYGAAFSSDFSVNHIRVNDNSGLERLQSSKYSQSNLSGVFGLIEEDARENRLILFSGTPCQVASVKKYFLMKNIPIENLFLMDFICHGVPSPGVWESYLTYKQKGKSIQSVNFRDKRYGWHNYSLNIQYEDKREYHKSHELDPFMRSFLSDKNIRPSCYECIYKGKFYASDLTLGDAWKIEKYKPEWADDGGTSLFIVRSSRGHDAIYELCDNFAYISSDYSKWSHMNPSLIEPTNRPNDRDHFFSFYNSNSVDYFWRRYSKIPARKRMKYFVKQILKKTGLEKSVRKLI